MGKDETAKEDENTEKSQSTGVNLALLVGCIILLVIITFLISIHLGSPTGDGDDSFFSYSKSDLGTLGDLLGGALNPILSFATICLLVWSIQIQIKELQEARREMERSSDALELTNSMHEKNIQAQERASLIPIAKPRLDSVAKQIFEKYRDDIVDPGFVFNSYNSDDVRTKPLRYYIQQILDNKPIEIVIDYKLDSAEFKKIKELAAERILELIFSVNELSKVCNALVRIKADKFLYYEEVRQVQSLLNDIHLFAVACELKQVHLIDDVKNQFNNIEVEYWRTRPAPISQLKPYIVEFTDTPNPD